MSRITGHRETAYAALVAARKTCHRCQGLANPTDGRYRQFDSDEIGPWSCWQGNLHSRVMVVGQDWGDTSYFLKWEGRDQPTGNPTNENLRTLLTEIGYHIGGPQEYQEQVLFLTNTILCLKEGGLQGEVLSEWLSALSTSSSPFLPSSMPLSCSPLARRPAVRSLMLTKFRSRSLKALPDLFKARPMR